MSNLGRNDRCHCGSGKKYKQCHMREDAARASEQRSLKTLTEWVTYWGRALRESVHPRMSEVADQAEAAAAWFPQAPESPGADPLFRDHLLYDVKVGETPLIAHGTLEGEAPSGDKALLRNGLQASRLSLYQVKEAKRGKGVRLEEPLTGASRWVGDVALAEELEPLEVVLGRVVVLKDRHSLIEGWRKVEFRKRKAAIKDLKAVIDAEGIAEDDIDARATWVRENAPQIARRTLEAGLQ